MGPSFTPPSGNPIPKDGLLKEKTLILEALELMLREFKLVKLISIMASGLHFGARGCDASVMSGGALTCAVRLGVDAPAPRR